MRLFKTILVLAILGLAFSITRDEVNNLEESGFLDFFSKIGDGFKKMGNGIKDIGKKAVNTVKKGVVDKFGKEILVKKIIKEGIVNKLGKDIIVKKIGSGFKKMGNGIKDIGKKAVHAVKKGVVDKFGKEILVKKFGKDILVKKIVKEGIVNKLGKDIIVKKIGKEGIVNKLGKDIIVDKIGHGVVLKGIEETKKGFMKFAKFTEQQSKKYISEVKKIGEKVGKTLDPRQITKILNPKMLKEVLKGIQMVAGPIEGVMASPMFQSLMASNPLLKTAGGFLIAGVKLVNHPEDYQNILMDSNIVSDLIGHFVVDTVRDPDHWMEHVVTAAPKAMELVQTAASIAAMAV